jgi:hypothetical protein
MEEQEIKKMLAQPFYAVNISDSLFGKHDNLVTKEVWVASATKLIREIGISDFLYTLLDCLENPTVSNDGQIDGYKLGDNK